LYAPPRSTFAPALATASAVANNCCSFSIVHGPAITITSLPPIVQPFSLTSVLSRLNVRLDSLYGSLTRTASCTPSITSNSRGSIVATSPTTPRTV